MSDWIQTELSRQLRPVAAPEALWDRIQHAPARKTTFRPGWLMPALAACMVLLTAGLLWGITHLRDIAPLTDGELNLLSDPSAGQTYRSDDPVQIRNWVKSKGNIDIELPSSRSEAIHLLGAKLVQMRGTLIAAVAYRVGNDSATLLVSPRNGTGGSKHLFSKANTTGGTSLVSWNMRDQAYTIAYAGLNDPQGGCLLCHAERRL